MNDIQLKRAIQSVRGLPAPAAPDQPPVKRGAFGALLEDRIKFSGHAMKRAEDRGIPLSPERVAQVGDAVEQAKWKGLRDALIVQNQTAFIVNVPSKTVVTVLSRDEMKSHVFTNIDGAVIL